MATILLVATLGSGCSGNQDKGPSLSPQTVSSVASPDSAPSEREPEAAAVESGSPPDPDRAPSGEPSRPGDEDRPDLTIVIDEGEGKSGRPSLIEASRAERERRREVAPSKIVITDENLKEKATGVLTVAAPDNQIGARRSPGTPGGSSAEPSAETGDGDPPPAGDPRNEDYWKGRALQARLAWREATDEIERLQGTVNRLRRRFYEEDDPYYRDTQIKPAWDRALDRLQEAREVAASASGHLDELLEEGRRAGALPGWLREGIDLEPGRERERTSGVEEYEVGEPEVYRPEEDGDGR